MNIKKMLVVFLIGNDSCPITFKSSDLAKIGEIKNQRVIHT